MGFLGCVALLVGVLWVGAQTPEPTEPAEPASPAAPAAPAQAAPAAAAPAAGAAAPGQKAPEPPDQTLRIALATARIRALTAAIEFNAIRLVLANLNNDQAVLDSLNQTLAFLTSDQSQAAAAGAAQTPVQPETPAGPAASPKPDAPAGLPATAPPAATPAASGTP
jgi:2-oxoglutarate dehydrogenase E2 component (dihydrolipoamide succinyltransferase)